MKSDVIECIIQRVQSVQGLIAGNWIFVVITKQQVEEPSTYWALSVIAHFAVNAKKFFWHF